MGFASVIKSSVSLYISIFILVIFHFLVKGLYLLFYKRPTKNHQNLTRFDSMTSITKYGQIKCQYDGEINPL